MKTKPVRNLTAALVCLALAGCSASGSDTGSTTAQTTAAASTESATMISEDNYPDYVTEPITITIWHASAAGKNGDYMTAAIEEFNATNEYGITVEELYAGSYADVLSKTSTALAAQDAPNLVVLGSSGIPILGEDGILADMAPYVSRDGIDMSNFVDGTTDFCYHGSEIISIPFNRSTAIFYYNKTVWDELGLEPPTDLADMEEKASYIHDQKGIYGFGLWIDAFFYQEAMVRSLGADGFVSTDGNSAASLDDGSFVTMMTDWRSWIDDGWCRVAAVTSSESDMREAFYKGEVACIFASCGGLANIQSSCDEAGFELGVSYMPVYGGYGSNGGGGNISIIGTTHTQQEIAASWEFIKFLSTDEMVARRAANTGYLPVTYSSTETDTIQELWKNQPAYQVAFEQLQYCKDANYSIYQSEWNTYLKNAMSYVTQDFSMTPEEANDYLKQQAAIIFPD